MKRSERDRGPFSVLLDLPSIFFTVVKMSVFNRTDLLQLQALKGSSILDESLPDSVSLLKWTLHPFFYLLIAAEDSRSPCCFCHTNPLYTCMYTQRCTQKQRYTKSVCNVNTATFLPRCSLKFVRQYAREGKQKQWIGALLLLRMGSTTGLKKTPVVMYAVIWICLHHTGRCWTRVESKSVFPESFYLHIPSMQMYICV